MRLAILATDIDDQPIARARQVCYPSTSLKDLPENWRTQAFERTAEGFRIKPEFQEPVTFLVQDIRQTVPEESFHLILCRYLVFTDFDATMQNSTLRQLVDRIRIGGALVIGRGETLPDGEFGLTPWSEKEGVYRRA